MEEVKRGQPPKMPKFNIDTTIYMSGFSKEMVQIF